MPQLDFSTFPSQIFWLIITFGLLYLILAKNFLPRIGSVLEQRRDTVDHDLMKAQQLRAEAQQALEEYEEALVQARSDAQRLAQEVRDEIAKIAAEQEAQAMEKISARMVKAEEELAQLRKNAEEQLPEIVADVGAALRDQFAPNINKRSFTAAIKAQLR